VASVDELLREATGRLRESGSATPRLDAEVLLAATLDLDRTRVIAHADAPVGDERASAFRAAVGRRAAGEPVAYIRGIKEFFGLAFVVDRRALIPRPETELLVDLGSREVTARLADPSRRRTDPPIRVLDVGTGSGAVAVALAVTLRRRRMERSTTVLATDTSGDALELAAENVAAHAVADVVILRHADLAPADAAPFDVVLANLPYVRRDAMDRLPAATGFEPRAALDGGGDGLEIIRRLLDRLPALLSPGGAAFLEIGGDQLGGIERAVAERLAGWRCEVARDLGGLPRVARIERASAGIDATRAGDGTDGVGAGATATAGGRPPGVRPW
jgi:release factor glutamine methyltransferase